MKLVALLSLGVLFLTSVGGVDAEQAPDRKVEIPLALITGVRPLKVEAGLNAEGERAEIATAQVDYRSTSIEFRPKPGIVDPTGQLHVALISGGQATPVLPKEGVITVVIPASPKPSDASLRIAVDGGKIIKGHAGTMSFHCQLTFDHEVRWPAPPPGSHRPFNHSVKITAPYQVLMGMTRFGLLASALDPERKIPETFNAPSAAVFRKDEKPPHAYIDDIEVGKIVMGPQGQSLSLPYSEKLWQRNPDVAIVYESTLEPVPGNAVAKNDAGPLGGRIAPSSP